MDLLEEGPVRRRHARRPSRARVLWTEYRVELIGLLLAAGGLFLVFEQLNLRKTFGTWFRYLLTGLLGRFQSLDSELAALLARLSLSDVVGAVMVVVALVAIVLRLRWRVLNSASLTEGNCPRCGGPIRRIHRRWSDRLICLYVPVRRYRCHDPACQWNGLRVGRHHVSARRRSTSPEGAK